jgi:signal peptide peptidase SppA
MPDPKPDLMLDPEFRRPWLIHPAWLKSLAEGSANREAPSAVATAQGIPKGESGLVEMMDGVAVIHIRGPIARYESILYWFVMTSVEALALEFRAALDDPSVRAILLDIDTPGGQVNGIHELAEMIYAARGIKPIAAYVGGMGDSAGYFLASAASNVVMDATAEVGSIGVAIVYFDSREADQKYGFREIEIVSSQSPKKRPDPATDEGRKQIQGQLDALAEVFIQSVARYRNVAEETVLNDFGQGDVVVGQAAVDRGMADRLGSFNELLEELQSTNSSKGEWLMPAPNQETTITRDLVMSKHPDIAEAIRKEGYEAGLKEGLEKGQAQGQAQERERIKGIEALAVPGHEALLAKLKFDEPATAEQAALQILGAEKATRQKMAADRQADAKALDGVGPGTVDYTGSEAQEKSLLDAMVQGGNSRRDRR